MEDPEFTTTPEPEATLTLHGAVAVWGVNVVAEATLGATARPNTTAEAAKEDRQKARSRLIALARRSTGGADFVIVGLLSKAFGDSDTRNAHEADAIPSGFLEARGSSPNVTVFLESP
ncbi:MAG TPA: hypothetical protein VNE22_01955 [Acidimicrobiales bacterium]|nr:hypothetical protein [Acidimicrobiales bacterium]